MISVVASACRQDESKLPAAQFEDGSFEAIVDKGGLDALMGEDTPGSEAAGGKLLAEVARLLSHAAGSAYLCVTLAQPHVLREPLLLQPCCMMRLCMHCTRTCSCFCRRSRSGGCSL